MKDNRSGIYFFIRNIIPIMDRTQLFLAWILQGVGNAPFPF